MKKNISILFLIITLFSINTRPVYAGIPVIDPAAIARMVIDFVTDNPLQVMQLAKETKTAIEVTATQINTFKTMWDQTIGRPLKDAMTLMAIAKDADQILNLVNGSTG